MNLLMPDFSMFDGRKALCYKGHAVDYAELDKMVGRLASGLKNMGVKKGDRAAVMLNNSPEFVICFFALSRIGAIAVLINTKSSEDELRYYVADALPSVVFFDSAIKEKIVKIMTEAADVRYIIAGSQDVGEKYVAFDDLSEGDRPLTELTGISPDDVLIWQYSTGSTGRPKRVCRTRLQLSVEVEHFTATVKVTKDDNFLAVVPMFHSHGLCNSMLASLCNGCCLVIINDFVPRDILAGIEKYRITIFPGVPFMFKMLSETYSNNTFDLSSLRLCFSAGANLSIDVSRDFHDRFGRFVFQLYGSTETGSVSINLPDADNSIIGKTLESVGRPMNGVQIEVFDEEGNVLKNGETGEIGIKSRAAIGSYPNLVRENKEAFRGGYFFPGDTGRIDRYGRLYITGRKKLVINVSGNKVDPAEVENVIMSTGRVKEVAVVGIDDAVCGEMVKAVVVPDGDITVEEIANICRSKLSDYKMPRVVEFREEIPKSPLGKILRKYLQRKDVHENKQIRF